ncbi:MAG: S41 family peptidase [Saprospiraceae bacterium]
MNQKTEERPMNLTEDRPPRNTSGLTEDRLHKRLNISFLVVFLLLLFGCSRETFVYDKAATFDELHQSIAKYSASIESRQIAWDEIGDKYRTEVAENLNETAYFALLQEMLLEFRDPHVWMFAPFDTLYSIEHLGYTKNYVESVTARYLTQVEQHSPQIQSGMINDSIGYLFCADFKGDVAANNEIYRQVFTKFSDTKGLIIDLRVNDGGSVYNAQNLLAKLTNEQRLWHTTQNRTLTGFDEKYEWYIEPDPEIYYAQPVVVLNGRFTISAGERFAVGATLLENVTIVGDTTANTQGSVMGREMLNGWTYTLTFEKCLAPDGMNYAGIGVPPDYFIAAENAILGGQDLILERGLELLE